MEVLSSLALPVHANRMVNYTFYEKETHFMLATNIASACLVVIGLVSNALALQVLSTDSLERTSFQIYFKWVCFYHLVSLLLTVLRQHTFLLDVDGSNKLEPQNRFQSCLGLLFGYIELEHCTTASLALLSWNRIWAQRNHDIATCHAQAMRNPILLNVSALLLAMIPTSTYIDYFRQDASDYNMTMCSFSFIHTYGSPRVQPPKLIFRAASAEELVLLFSFLALLVEIVNRIIRHKRGQQLVVSIASVKNGSSTPVDLWRISSEIDPVRRATVGGYQGQSSTTRLRALSTLSSHIALSPKRVPSSVEEMWDMGMSNMTVVYIAIYFIMAMPSRIVHYFFMFDEDDFPLLTMLSLLRQAFQAGTLLFLCMGSALMRHTIIELASESTDMRYTSSTALFDPASTRKAMGASRHGGWFNNVLSDPASGGSFEVQKSMRLRVAAEKAYEHKAASESQSRSTHMMDEMDRLVLGLSKSEVSRKQTIVLPNTKRSHSHSSLTVPESLTKRPSLTLSIAESDV